MRLFLLFLPSREIRDELAVSRGRVSLVDLASTLNVDFSHVEAQGQTVARQDGHRTHLVLGQLVDSDYLDSLCEQVNEGLQLNGTISISTLTKEYDLPSEFLQVRTAKSEEKRSSLVSKFVLILSSCLSPPNPAGGGREAPRRNHRGLPRLPRPAHHLDHVLRAAQQGQDQGSAVRRHGPHSGTGHRQ